ncbi:hypothetical protein RND71_003582 [Anisodus tanguticus]|uniref:Uncharacterized protein n=1 Tax=Anisodus tanguticus TaxID=243964 RepID=A0AAE1SYW0_9SOLA|nr:hypothetical protein RND71_003582 [Anisodus tanguticus]
MEKEATNDAKTQTLSSSAKRYCSNIVLEQPKPSFTSSSLVSTKHNISTDRGLHLGYENKNLQVDQATMVVRKEHQSQNVELIRICDSQSRKMADASRKRKRERNRNKKRKTAGTNETTCSYCTNKHARFGLDHEKPPPNMFNAFYGSSLSFKLIFGIVM